MLPWHFTASRVQMDLFWEKWESSGDVREMWVFLYTPFPQVFRRGSSVKDTGKTRGGMLLYDLEQNIFALGFSTLAHLHPAGAEQWNELQPGQFSTQGVLQPSDGGDGGDGDERKAYWPCKGLQRDHLDVARGFPLTFSAQDLYESPTKCFQFPCNI